MELQVDEEELIERMIARGRADDNREVDPRAHSATITARRSRCWTITASAGCCDQIDAMGTPDEVFAQGSTVPSMARWRSSCANRVGLSVATSQYRSTLDSA